MRFLLWVILQMMQNRNYLVGFVAGAQQLSQSRGESIISQQTWMDADAAYPWPDGVGTADFW